MVGLVLVTGGAAADVVRPPPRNCPPRHTPVSGHAGPHCRPPLPRCPRGHKPRVHRANAWCEPPAKTPCPDGTIYGSRSATNTHCSAGRKCLDEGKKWGEMKCVPRGLCVTGKLWEGAGRGARPVDLAVGSCRGPKDCSGKAKCVISLRMENPKLFAAPPPLVPPPGSSGPVIATSTTVPTATPSTTATPTDPTPTTDDAPPATTTPTEPTTPPAQPASGGCAGCTLAAAPSRPWIPALLGLGLLAVARRRRKQADRAQSTFW